MKRVIMILSDSLQYDDEFFKDMKNLAKMKKNSIVFENYFSNGPYTEAALNAIYSSMGATELKGYINNLKESPKTINEVFKENGYRTYNTLWFYPNTKSFLRGVDDYIYVDLYHLTYYMNEYRLKYFKQIFIENKFSSFHMKELRDMLDDFFWMGKKYIEDYYEDNKKFELLIKKSDFNDEKFKIIEKEMKAEIYKYNANKNEYVDEILKDENDFFRNECLNLKFNKSFDKIEIDKYIKKEVIKQLIRGIGKFNKNRCGETLGETLRNIFSNNKNATYSSLFSWIKYTVNHPLDYGFKSIDGGSILENTLEYLKEKKDEKVFCLCHLMDNHYPFNFMDLNESTSKEELDNIKLRLKECKNGENKFYKLSKEYVDEKIGELVENLKKNNMLEDTLIVITADHGSSYSNKIYRKKIVSNFYDENYRIPFIVYNPKIEGNICNNLGSAIDYIATLGDIIQLKLPKEIKGKSLLQENNENIFFEYFGAGCPDYILKNAHIANRNLNYKVCYVGSNKKFNEDKITEIYNLKEDKDEVNNLIKENRKEEEIINLILGIKEKIRGKNEIDNGEVR